MTPPTIRKTEKEVGMEKEILKSLNPSVEMTVDTYSKVFKFDLSCEGIERMLLLFIDRGDIYANRLYT